jgi:hypothetical protein
MLISEKGQQENDKFLIRRKKSVQIGIFTGTSIQQ